MSTGSPRARRASTMVLVIALSNVALPLAALPPVPESRREELVEMLHGVPVADPYRWLEDRAAPEVQAWIDAQEARTRAALDGVAGRDALETRLASLMRIDSLGTPVVRAGRYFYERRHADRDQFIVYVRDGLRGKERVLLDPHPWSEDHTTSVDLLDVSKDGTVAAYSVRTGGADEIEVRLIDVASGKDLPDRLPRARYWGVALTGDKSGFYYARHDQKEGPRLLWHRLGTDSSQDRIVFGEGLAPDKGVSPFLSHDDRWLMVMVWYGSAGRKTDVYVQDLASGGPFVPLVDDIDATFWGGIGDGHAYLKTDWNAPKGRIVAVDLARPDREHWREVVAEREASIESFSLVGGRLCATYLENVRPILRIFTPAGALERTVEFEGLGSASGLSGEWDSPEGFYSFSSFNVPSTIHRIDVATGKRTTWAAVEVPFDGRRFVVEQVWYASKDGTRIPMFLAHAKTAKRNGANPVFLTGYGGFRGTELPYFSASKAAWLEMGGIVAMPSLRGGAELGEDWHRAGMLEKKQNVFDDFIAAAQWLIDEGWTRPKRLAIQGTSNGGLLTGAAMIQRPELFGAVIIGYPLLDMVRYHRFLVAGFWVPEYGSADNPEQFPWIMAYSPYHHVQKGVRYPPTLLVTGDSDTRVDPLHARKMAAMLQWGQGGDAPVLLHYDQKAGHSGGTPVGKQVEDVADQIGFLTWQLGMTPPVAGAPSPRRNPPR